MVMRRWGAWALVGLCLGLAPGFAPRLARAGSRSGLELPGSAVDRGSRRTSFARPRTTGPATLRAIEAELGPVFASWDHDTGVPNRILPRGAVVAGAVADPSVAADYAREFLARHLDSLVPGASLDDFVLVSNEVSSTHRGPIRSVGFVQEHGGRRVLGGQLSFRFKADRLAVIASEAYPNVVVPKTALRVDDHVARSRAEQWLRDDGHARPRAVPAVDGPFILPIVLESGAIRYHEVVRTGIQTEAPFDHFEVFNDASTGEPVARRSRLLHAAADVRYNVPVRNPLGARADFPARDAGALVAGMPTTTSATGSLDFTGPADVTVTVSGSQVAVSPFEGPAATFTFPGTDGGTLTWGAADDEFVDAQLSAFVHARIVQDYVRGIAPDFGFLDQQLPVTVNITNDSCNAFSDGFSINFIAADVDCENTGRIADVVYHEFGHSSHTQSVIPGVGFFDVALSEGISDYLSATMTNDSGVGRGFFYDDNPLRELDPPGFEYRWPEDRGEVHDEGRIIGGALWDLRKELSAKYGPDVGVALTDEIWFEATRRASNIPTMYVETLLVDDDDGNLVNGTPNVCEINAAYGPHGLYQAQAGGERVALTDVGDSLEVFLFLDIPSFPACPVAAAPTIEWRLRDQAGGEGSATMGTDGAGAWFASIPRVPDAVTQYRVRANYSTGTERSLPDNFVDPWYETYVGEVFPLYCLDSDAGQSWFFEGTGSDWGVSPPLVGDANDPGSTFDSDGVYIAQTGPYEPGASTRAKVVVETQGFARVRLQYWRWLTVEDGFFDRASILVDGTPVWSNFASADDKTATFHHTDREWRFQDVDLSGFLDDGVVEVAFELQSDGGLEFGGWTIDGLCVVGVGATSTCGNGVIDAGEECDDGNRGDGDGCSVLCMLEDDEGQTTDGSPIDPSEPDTDGDEDTDTDTAGLDGGIGLIDRGCICTAGPGRTGPRDAAGPLGWLALFALLRRRRKR